MLDSLPRKIRRLRNDRWMCFFVKLTNGIPSKDSNFVGSQKGTFLYRTCWMFTPVTIYLNDFVLGHDN